MIDTRAIIDPTASIADNVSIGPWTIIGPEVEIGEGTEIGPHVIIKRNTRLGRNNRVYQFASVGEDPADKKFEGEETWLDIGDDNIIREGCTLHRGTGAGGAHTRIGSDNLFMAYVHVAHDSIVGNHTVFANNAGVSGHVKIDDWVVLGGFSGVNQFLHIGAHSMVGGMTHITHDLPAFLIVSGNPAAVRSVNIVGMERRGFSDEDIRQVRKAFKMVYKKGLGLQEALEQLAPSARENEAVQCFMDSINASTRGILR